MNLDIGLMNFILGVWCVNSCGISLLIGLAITYMFKHK